jgi:hypothetical protein
MRYLLILAFITTGSAHALSFNYQDDPIECPQGWTPTPEGNSCVPAVEGRQGSGSQAPRAERPDPRSERPDPRSERPDPRSQGGGSREDDLEDERFDSENCVGPSWTRRPRGPGASFDAYNSCGRTPPPPPRR